MKTRRLISTILLVSLLWSPFSSLATYSQNGAESYLQAHSNNPWSTMALAALGTNTVSTEYLKNISGTSAIEFAAPILAINSLGLNPRTFSDQNLVDKLLSFHNSGQLGDPSALNDDAFGVIALLSSGVPVSDSVVNDSKNFLLSHQNPDGGWGYSTQSPSDSNTTASVIIALNSTGQNTENLSIQKALNYLKSAQNSDGGFTYDPKSTYGTLSDSSSTAWVVWALNGLKIDTSTWSQGNNSPISYLQSNQDSSGFFKFQPDSSEDNFSPITTAYAVIALTGNTLPINSKNSSPQTTYSFRIEGSAESVCYGHVQALTALDVVKNSSQQCGYNYHISNLSFGQYLDNIGNNTASGQVGWMYLVNNATPNVGASDYLLSPGDELLWYFGEFGWSPTRLTANQTQSDSGQPLNVTVEYYEKGSWKALNNARVTVGINTFYTDASGNATISVSDGYYKIFAEKEGYIRSNQTLIQIGTPTGSAVKLSANITSGEVQGTSTPKSSLYFVINSDSLDFGSVSPASANTRQIKIDNKSEYILQLFSNVSGDNIFTDNLKINEQTWQKYAADLNPGSNRSENIQLVIPKNSLPGPKTGQLIFWAKIK